mmetsp:Transcript_16639/g.37399  ORF Transcript_16639/g.37399 Transcript_16639/m.37399 type:complete len:163 (-) Transcript_16639:314-802(-)
MLQNRYDEAMKSTSMKLQEGQAELINLKVTLDYAHEKHKTQAEEFNDEIERRDSKGKDEMAHLKSLLIEKEKRHTLTAEAHQKEIQRAREAEAEVINLNAELQLSDKKHTSEMQKLREQFVQEKDDIYQKLNLSIKSLEEKNIDIKQASANKLTYLLNILDN